jgi:hypothetical protein
MNHFFGVEWLKKHFIHAKKTSYLGFDLSNDTARERRTWRVIHLAEMLFNMQHIAGFDACIAQMAGGKIESTYAELEIGKELFWRDVRFRFGRRTGVKKQDYDLEITFRDGRVACADTKCKLEKTKFTTTTLLNSLHEARTQLPSDKPGIIFVRMPEHWLDNRYDPAPMIDTAEDFLRRTGRIVSVKFLCPLFVYDGERVMEVIRLTEVMNPDHRQEGGTDWTLLVTSDKLIDHQPTPRNWVSLDEFE